MKLQEADGGVTTIISLFSTRFSAGTSAMEAVLKDYTQLLEILEEINSATHDEYGLKAGGLMQIGQTKISLPLFLKKVIVSFSRRDSKVLHSCTKGKTDCP